MKRLAAALFLLCGAAPLQDPAALIEQLGAEDIAVREKAFAELEKLGFAVEERLKKAAAGSDIHLAQQAKRLLHILELERTLPAALKREFPGIARRLGRSGGEEATQTYLAVADANDVEPGKTPYSSLTRADLEPLALDAVRHARTVSDKAHVCRTAGRWFHRSATTEILKLHRDADDEVRNAARWSLAALWGKSQAVAMAVKEVSGETIFLAETLSGRPEWADEKLLASLVPLLGHDEERIRDAAFDSLDDSPPREAFAAILALLKEPEAGKKSDAMRFLSRQKHRQGGPSILPLLGDADEEIRQEAFDTLGQLSFEIPAPDLLKLVRDPDMNLAAEAILLARQRKLPDLLPLLHQLLESEHAELRRAALEGMKELKDPELVERAMRLPVTDSLVAWILSEPAPDKAIERARAVLDAEAAIPDARLSSLSLLEKLKSLPSNDKLRSLAEGGCKPLAAQAFTMLAERDVPAARLLLPHLLEDEVQQRYIDVGRLIFQLAPDNPVPSCLKVLALENGNHDSVCKALAARKPPAAISALREMLKKEEPALCAGAVKALIGMKAVEARPELIALLSKDDANLQYLVLTGLEELGLGDDWRPVAAVFEREKSNHLRMASLKALAKRPHKEMIPLFVQVMGDWKGYQSEFPVASSALVELGHEGFLEVLLGWFSSGIPFQIGVAAPILAATDPPGFRERIPSLLEAREARIRETGISLIETLGMKEAAPKLLPMLREPATGGRALDAIVALDARGLIPELEALLRSDEFEVRENALLALAGLRSHPSVPAIRALLDHPELEAQWTAIRALGALRDRESGKRLLAWLKSPRPSMRYRAVKALGSMGDPSTAGALLPLLIDERGELQEHVVQALGELKCREAVPELLRLLKVPENHRSILPALEDIGAREAVPELIKGLEAGGCEVCYPKTLARMKAADAASALRKLWENNRTAGGSGSYLAGLLAEVGDRSCLLELLTSGKEKERVSAAGALVKLGDPRGIAPLLESSDPSGQELAGLNAVRKPDKRSKLAAASHSMTVFGSRRKRIERFAGIAGFQVRWEGLTTLASKEWATSDLVLGDGRDPEFDFERWEHLFGERAQRYADDRHLWTYIVEDDHIRVLPVESAVKFWKQWWADEQGKKK